MDPKKITGLQLSDRELDEATRRLAFFAPSGAKQYVEELFSFLAEQALASMQPGAWPGPQIHAKLRELTGIRIEYEELLAGLSRLVQNDLISCSAESVFSPHARFSMLASARQDILKRSKVQRRQEKRVVDRWKGEISRLYPDLTSDELTMLEEDLREYVYRLVSYSSIESVLLYYSGEKDLDSIAGELEAESIDQVLTQRPERLTMIRAEVLPKFFRSGDEERKNFINGLLQSTFILHMIQLDPTCSAIVRAQVLGGTIYLDTNFVFRLLGLHSPEMFFAARELVNLSRKLNYSLFVTPVTHNEYLHALRDYLRELERAPQLPSDLLRAVVDISDDADPIIAYYRKMVDMEPQKGAYVPPEVYYEYFVEVQALLEPFGIAINDDLCEDILSQEDDLNLETNRLKRFEDERRLSSKQYYHELSAHVAEHDAFHRLLIVRLRAGHDGAEFFDVPYWFLTCDSKLPMYDRVRRGSEGLATPFCVMSAQWLQTLRPFAPRLSPSAIVDSISSPLLRAYDPIPNSVIREVAGRVRLHRRYTPAVGKVAMKRQFLMQFAQASEEEEKQELIENVFLEYAEEMEKLKDEAEQARLDAEMRTDQLRNELSELRSEVKEAKSRVAEERQARGRAEDALDEVEGKEARIRSELDGLRAELSKVSRQHEQSRRNAIALLSVVVCTVAVAIARPWISGKLWWFALTGVLITLYVASLTAFRPMRGGRWGKLFTFGFPLVILGSAALPLGQGQVFFEVLGFAANIGGVVSFLVFLLGREKDGL